MAESRFPFEEVDRELVAVAPAIKILSHVAWPPELCDRFLDGWRAGAPKLPEPPATQPIEAEVKVALERLAKPVADHPIAMFLARTAGSYLVAAQMLDAAATPAFTEHSIELYGAPRDVVAPGGLSNLAAAEHFIRETDALAHACQTTEQDYCLIPSFAQAKVQAAMDAVFVDHTVSVVLDDTLSAKATAGVDRIRLRGTACFSEADVAQLIHHEGYIHTATLINGRLQPHITALGLNGPRTTATQEGLATFAEFITGSVDLNRLRRLALRITAIQTALDGGDFIDVFRYLLEAGQSERESYQSAARIFRGGAPRGRVCFTKDNVYLRGLLRTHTFVHAAVAEQRLDLVRSLFVGRLSWSDLIELQPMIDSGLIIPGRYIPPWVANRNTLAGYLAFSSLTHSLPLQEARISDFSIRTTDED